MRLAGARGAVCKARRARAVLEEASDERRGRCLVDRVIADALVEDRVVREAVCAGAAGESSAATLQKKG